MILVNSALKTVWQLRSNKDFSDMSRSTWTFIHIQSSNHTTFHKRSLLRRKSWSKNTKIQKFSSSLCNQIETFLQDHLKSCSEDIFILKQKEINFFIDVLQKILKTNLIKWVEQIEIKDKWIKKKKRLCK